MSYNPQYDPVFEVEERPRIQNERSIRIVEESQPLEPQRHRLQVGKILNCPYKLRSGEWLYGIVISDSGRWRFGAKDVLCSLEDLKEGMVVSFRGLLPPDFRDIGYAGSVEPYDGSHQREPRPEPSHAVTAAALQQLREESSRSQQEPKSEPPDAVTAPSWQQEPDYHPPIQRELVEKLGTIDQFGEANGTGTIKTTDGNSYMFFVENLVSGFATVGESVRFRTYDDGFALEISIT